MSFYVRVHPTLEVPGLRLRAQSTTESAELAFEEPGAVLTVIEAEYAASLKIGVAGQWLHVRDAQAREGYVAAWYVESVNVEQDGPTHAGPSCETREEEPMPLPAAGDAASEQPIENMKS